MLHFIMGYIYHCYGDDEAVVQSRFRTFFQYFHKILKLSLRNLDLEDMTTEYYIHSNIQIITYLSTISDVILRRVNQTYSHFTQSSTVFIFFCPLYT